MNFQKWELFFGSPGIISISFQIILNAPQDIALKAIEILKEIYTNLGSDLKTKPVRKFMYTM